VNNAKSSAPIQPDFQSRSNKFAAGKQTVKINPMKEKSKMPIPLKLNMKFDDAMRLISKVKPPEKKPVKRKK
jgi:hypothetical protein